MATLIAVMLGGLLAGRLLRGRTGHITWVSTLTRPVIFALLFLMGITLGLDERTMDNLSGIGLSSLGFAVLTVAGSMTALALVLPFVKGSRLR